jgi:NAD(P)H-quinone oxidoreductase subunit 5
LTTLETAKNNSGEFKVSSLMTDFVPARAALLYAIPLLYLLVALMPAVSTNQPDSALALARRWRWARWIAGLAILITLGSMLWLAMSGAITLPGATLIPLGEFGALTLGIRSDALGCTVLLLVTFIGWVIVGYSQPYLAGEPNQARYIRALLLTLAAVSLVIITNNLLMLALAWLGTSLALHQLLMFYGDRRPAQIAAHKKFLASRLADVCIFTAIALIGGSLGTLEIDEVLSRVVILSSSENALPFTLQMAAVLIVFAALLKCAQLPLHGWLIQVMEAPTPVSALLHAGVVNLGGFVLIRLATLIAEVPLAQALLVVIGGITAVVAALVMMTRISIKVMLAWSTCAQMGFMLMQCGLGAYEMALLHLVAHSLYKAHAFLGSGSAVEQARLRQMTFTAPASGVGTSLLSAMGGLSMVAAAAYVWNISPSESPALVALASIVSLALATLLAPLFTVPRGVFSVHGGVGALGSLGLLAVTFSVALAYFGLHHVFSMLIDLPARTTTVTAGLFALIAFTLACFALLFLLQSLIRANPAGKMARNLYPWFYNGLYLDPLFTRITFRVWPVSSPDIAKNRLASSGSSEPSGAMK